MLYLTLGTNQIPMISTKTCTKLVLIDQITKKEYSYSLELANNGRWYVLYIGADLPVSQYDVYIYADDGSQVLTMLAQYGDYIRTKTEYSQSHKIKTYNG